MPYRRTSKTKSKKVEINPVVEIMDQVGGELPQFLEIDPIPELINQAKTIPLDVFKLEKGAHSKKISDKLHDKISRKMIGGRIKIIY